VEPHARRAREQLDRPVVVRRAEPAGDDEQVVVEPFAQRLLEVGGVVADDRDPRWSDDARNGPLRSCRSPRTSSEPVATIVARRLVMRAANPSG
jgi:hypothetical protein